MPPIKKGKHTQKQVINTIPMSNTYNKICYPTAYCRLSLGSHCCGLENNSKAQSAMKSDFGDDLTDICVGSYTDVCSNGPPKSPTNYF